jgi:hypothetical protein
MKTEKVVYTGKLEDVANEDGGMALISEPFAGPNAEDNGMFVKIQSWDEECKHDDFKKFQGRKIKVTIETID